MSHHAPMRSRRLQRLHKVVSRRINSTLRPMLSNIPIRRRLPYHLHSTSVAIRRVNTSHFRGIPTLKVELRNNRQDRASRHYVLTPIGRLPTLHHGLRLALRRGAPIQGSIPSILRDVGRHRVDSTTIDHIIRTTTPRGRNIKPSHTRINGRPRRRLLHLTRKVQHTRARSQRTLRSNTRGHIHVLSRRFAMLLRVLLSLTHIHTTRRPRLVGQHGISVRSTHRPPRPRQLILRGNTRRLIRHINSTLSTPSISTSTRHVDYLFRLTLLGQRPSPSRDRLVPLTQVKPSYLAMHRNIQRRLTTRTPSFGQGQRMQLGPLPRDVLRLTQPHNRLRRPTIRTTGRGKAPGLRTRRPRHHHRHLLATQHEQRPIRCIQGGQYATLILVSTLNGIHSRLTMPRVALPLQRTSRRRIVLVHRISRPLIGPQRVRTSMMRRRPRLTTFGRPPSILTLRFRIVHTISRANCSRFTTKMSTPYIQGRLISRGLQLHQLRRQSQQRSPSRPT